MKALVGAFNQEKALVGAFSVIVQPVVEPMEHRQLRDRWRHELRARAGVRLLFLNSAARTAGDQRLLEAEAGEQGDILQCGVEDGHRRLGYKV